MSIEKNQYSIDVIMAIITQCIYTTANIETKIELLSNAGVTVNVNDLKTGNTQTLPTSWIESIFRGGFSKLLKLEIGNLIWGDSANFVDQKVHPFC
jgi:hypothetical protein